MRAYGESAEQEVDSSQWKAAILFNVCNVPIIGIKIGKQGHRKGQWIPSHVVLPDAFRAKHPHFATPTAMYLGLAIYVFFGSNTEMHHAYSYLKTDVLFAATADLKNDGNTISGTIDIPIRDKFDRKLEFENAVKVESSDPMAWPDEIRKHPDLKRRFLGSFREQLAGRPSIAGLLVPESVPPVPGEIICATPAPQMAMNAAPKKLKELWQEALTVMTLLTAEAERRRQRDNNGN